MSHLAAIAASWEGTPFIPGAALKGEGVDCVHLAGEILREAGYTVPGAWPAYRCDAGDHAEASILTGWLDASASFRRLTLTVEPIQPADLLCFRLGRVPHHVGVALGAHRFIHAMRGYGVRISDLRDPTFARRFTAAYRPLP